MRRVPNSEPRRAELRCAEPSAEPGFEQTEPKPVSRAEKRALSQAEHRFGAEPNRAPSQAEPGLEPMTGKSSLSGSDQPWWRKLCFIGFPSCDDLVVDCIGFDVAGSIYVSWNSMEARCSDVFR